ncbi:MAG: CopG family transcriptional regulator [Butyrivibrio sp.]|nr:CopG family transcriptional regulator [Butyrivibrio sp.]
MKKEAKDLIIRSKRPKGEDGYKTFSIRVKEDIVAQIEQVASQTGHTRNELIGIFLEHAVEYCTIEK